MIVFSGLVIKDLYRAYYLCAARVLVIWIGAPLETCFAGSLKNSLRKLERAELRSAF